MSPTSHKPIALFYSYAHEDEKLRDELVESPLDFDLGYDDVAECAVIGAADALKGETPLGLVVLKAKVARPHEEIAAELVGMVRERIGPVASFKVAAVVRRLPKTRSGKIVRGTIKKQRRGAQKAKVAAARKLLIRSYILLRDEIDYAEFLSRGVEARLARLAT